MYLLTVHLVCLPSSVQSGPNGQYGFSPPQSPSLANLNFLHQVLAELKKSNFTLLNQTIQFNEYGDPKFGSYSIVFWNNEGIPEEVGFFQFPAGNFYINSSKIQWFTNGEVSKYCAAAIFLKQILLV